MLKITAGEFRGRKLKTPKKSSIRPTSSKVREAIFNILGDRIQDCRWMDLYSGSGIMGLEALSRGASFAVFVDHNRAAISLIRENARVLGMSEQVQVINAEVLSYVRQANLNNPDIIYIDPPYRSGEYIKLLTRLGGRLTGTPNILVEHHKKNQLPSHISELELVQLRHYGDTCVSFYHLLSPIDAVVDS